jgi:hypothetical protein
MRLSLDPKNIFVVDGEYTNSTYWSEKIYENNHIFDDECWICFESSGFLVNVEFDLSVSGYTYSDRGDFWTPSYSETTIDEVILNVKSVQINDYPLNLKMDLRKKFEEVVKSII